MPNPEYRAISQGFSVLTDYDQAALYRNPYDDFRSSLGGYSIYMTQVVPGGSYGFGDGLVGTPSIFFQNDQDCGFYRVGNDDWAASVAGAKVTEWVAGGFRISNLTTGSVLFAAANGLVSQNNASFFWDNANTRLEAKGHMRVGTATEADATGEFSTGVTGSGRMHFFRRSGTDIISSQADDAGAIRIFGASANEFFDFSYYAFGALTHFRNTSQQWEIWAYNSTTASSLPVATFITRATSQEFQVRNQSDTAAIAFSYPNSTFPRICTDSATTLGLGSNSTPSLLIINGGNVGINTVGAAPDRMLDVLHASDPQLRLTQSDGSVYVDFQTSSFGHLSIVPTGTVGTWNKSASGSTMEWRAENSDNSNTGSHALVRTVVGGTSAGDPFFQALIDASGLAWSWGIDNSDSDKFKISQSTGLGTSDALTITTAGLVTVPLGDLYVQRSNSGATVLLVLENTSTGASSGARFDINVASGAVGDPYILMTNQVVNWATGIDNSDSDRWKVSASGALGTTDIFIGTTTGSVAAGTASLATTATDGFLYVPACAGTPTGVPTTITGYAPIVVDSTNNIYYFYSNAAWRQAGGSSGSEAEANKVLRYERFS